jgi:Kef-type K+ transport system membrane component KefB
LAEPIFHVLVSLAVLLFAAKLGGKLMQKIKQPVVLGEILAGMAISPFALGGLPLINGQPLIVLDETILFIGEISAIIILFVAGMGTTPREFKKLGASAFTVGALGVIAPFFVGYFVLTAVGVGMLPSIIMATALTATSIAISVTVLNELGRLHSREGRLILGAAVADDILAIAVLSVVLTMVRTGNVNPEIGGVSLLLLQVLGVYAAILIASVFAVPRLLDSRLWKQLGSVEAAATAVCFAISGAGAAAGLSPIVGAFTAGMAVTASKAFHQIKEYAEKLEVFFGPLFFVIIGARVDLRGVNLEVMLLAGIVIAIAVVTKLAGCGLPSMIFLKNKDKAMKVGIGMISRGEVGLIVAAAGASAGVLSGNLYSTIVIMVAVTTIITPVWLKMAYKKDPPEPAVTQALEKGSQ